MSRAEDGWNDLAFTITEKQLQEDNTWNMVCKANYQGQVVGFRVLIEEGIEPGIVNDDLDGSKFLKDAIVIKSIGEESDKLAEIMSILYEQPTANSFTDIALGYTVFPLNKDKANLRNGYFKFKLFYDDNDELGQYSELYLNINLPDGTVELNEKDEGYRENIIKHFRGA